MDDYTAKHLHRWIDMVELTGHKQDTEALITAFVEAHPDVVGPGQNYSWPEINTMAQRWDAR